MTFSSNWCGPHVAAWRLLLPESGALILRNGWRMGLCEFRSSPSFLSVGRFEPPPQKPKWPLVPMIFGEPLQASVGRSLSYVVILMNVPPNGPASNSPSQAGSFTFHLPCPSYVERLTQGRRLVATERHVLNCAGVGTIPGNVAVRFAMQMRLPAALSARRGSRGRLTHPSASHEVCQ